MQRANRYKKHAQISDLKFRQLLKLFCLDLTAVQIAKITALNRNTVNSYLAGIRKRIVVLLEENTLWTHKNDGNKSGQESHLFPNNQKTVNRGKVLILGLREERGYVGVEVVQDRFQGVSRAFIHRKVNLDSVIQDSGWPGYDALVDLGRAKYRRIRHQSTANAGIDDLEAFWGFVKVRLIRFRGMNKKVFRLHLKECEFRYNYRHREIYKELLKEFKKRPLF